MGQIATDFENWVNENKPLLTINTNIKRVSSYVEEFLIWKAEQIKRNTDDNLNSHHGYPPQGTIIMDDRLTRPEIERIVEQLSKD